MPELPDLELYRHALSERLAGERLEGVRVRTPFLLRSVEPPLASADGRKLGEVRRIGKRLVFALEGDLFLVLHLMIAGRLRWRPPGAKIPGKIGLAAFDFEPGTVLLTEAGSKRRASLHVVEGEEALARHDPGGVEPLTGGFEAFAAALRRENHTLKRALTDPRILSGIGNAYSDEILHRAKLSPFVRTQPLDNHRLGRLYTATRQVLGAWTVQLREQAGDDFPEKVTAFRPEMAVHGRFGEPCPACGEPVQRIVYAESEANYCAACQTDRTVLKDRALSRLLHEDWPRTLEELEGRGASS